MEAEMCGRVMCCSPAGRISECEEERRSKSEIYWTVSFLHTLINKTVEKCVSIHMCGPY